jgi:hypothetical protein
VLIIDKLNVVIFKPFDLVLASLTDSPYLSPILAKLDGNLDVVKVLRPVFSGDLTLLVFISKTLKCFELVPFVDVAALFESKISFRLFIQLIA